MAAEQAKADQDRSTRAKGGRGPDIGRMQRIVSPGRGFVAGTIALQIGAFTVLVGLLVAQVIADRRQGMHLLASKTWMLIPFVALVASEVLRRWTSRRLFLVHERGISFPEGRRTRAVGWDEIARVEQGPGSCRIHLREGEPVELAPTLARNEAVREALRDRPAGA